MNKRRLLVIMMAVVVAVVITVGVVQGHSYWKKEYRQPSSLYVGGSTRLDRPFQHIGCKVWRTGSGDLFYALIMGYVDFEPTMPSYNIKYSWNAQKGGELVVNGERVNYSAKKRLLALNPFGDMQEIVLSDSEAEAVVSADAEKIWETVVLKRLYGFKGDQKDAKRVGQWVCSDSVGRKAYEGAYVDGKRDGKWVYFYPSGTVRAEIHYSNGKRHGKWSYFAEDGKPADCLTWDNDFPVERPARQGGLGHTDVLYPNGNSHHSSY